MDTNSNGRPVMHWVEVPDTRGGTRLEARWSVPGVPMTQVATAAQVAHAA